MCMAAVAIGASILSAGVGAYSAYAQGQAQSAQYDYQRKVNEQNARTADWKADDARVRGQEAEVAQRRKTGMLLETQKASLAGTGFDIGGETPSAILSDTAALGEIDAQTIRKNALRDAWGYEQQAVNFRQNATMSGAASENASTAGFINAGSSLFSGASSVADKWSNYSSKWKWNA